MGRIILGVIVGFIAWSILWVGGEEVISQLSPDWYGTHRLALEKAIFNKAPFEANPAILVIYLVRSALTSLIAGFLAAIAANEKRRTTTILGVLLLAVGIVVQLTVWGQLPLWYHLIFLALLAPMTIAGGMLRRSS